MKERTKQAEGQGKKGALGRLDVFALAFGAMIGWGWVALSGEWIGKAGAIGAVIAFVLGGILVLFVGLVYAELSSAMPDTDGVLLFSKRAFGRGTAYICTWAILLGFSTSAALQAVALPTVVTYFFPGYIKGFLYSVAGFDIYATWLLVGVGASVLVSIINFMGVEVAAKLQTILTGIIALTRLLLVVGSLHSGSLPNLQPEIKGGFGGILAVAAMTPLMYIGFDVIPQAAGEMDIAPRKIGVILILSVVLAISWYVIIIFCVGYALPAEEMANSALPTADAVKYAYGGSDFMGKVLVLGGLSGILSSWNAFYIGATRLIYAMARDGMLPSVFAKMNDKHHTPQNAILLIAVVTSAAPLLGKNMLTWLCDAGGFATILTYVIVTLAFLALHRKEPDMERPYQVKRWKLVGGLALVLCVVMLLLYLPGFPASLVWPYEWAIVLLWVILGVILYVLAKGNQRKS